MIKIQCVVEHITFQNEENGYTVLKGTVKGYIQPVTLVGCMLGIAAGMVLECEGNWTVNKHYGDQFAVERWMEVMPATAYGIERYLGSGLVKGVGRKYAKLIVKRFGTDTIHVIENNIERLLEIPGIGQKRIDLIRESWAKQKAIQKVMIFLQSYEVSTAHAVKIYQAYGNQSIEKVKSNPYCLADDIRGIGFLTADKIARSLGYMPENQNRCKSGILYAIRELANQGHVFATHTQLENACETLLKIEWKYFNTALTDMCSEKRVVFDKDVYYLSSFFHAEVNIAKKLSYLIKVQQGRLFEKPLNIKSIEKSSGITYDEVQKEAIRVAVKSKVMILTGGPGTGKTTTTQGILNAFKTMDLQILLAAPTGRAAKRMSEATQMEAKTIHRLLEYKPDEGYNRNEMKQLEGDVLIVDECSMIDLKLMNHLVRAIPSHMRLVLVGDINQLPSVGAGNVLKDLIDSQQIPVVRLTRIFRQAQSSRIVMSAHAINEGEMPNLSNGQKTDFFFIHQNDAERVPADIVKLVKERLPNAYHEPVNHIQVLTPMLRGLAGTSNLNQMLQEALNPETTGIMRSGTLFKTGDRVMQIQNNYDKDVYNGDIGVIEDVNQESRIVTVNFEGHLVTYEVTELEELMLAYATTIHKSQGCEYPIVVIPIVPGHTMMLQRNLIYTAITRSKKICVLIGQTKALEYSIHNVTVDKRNSLLKERLMEAMSKDIKELTPPNPLDFLSVKNTADVSTATPVCQTEDVYDILERLRHSDFRNSFHLEEENFDYIYNKGMETIQQHAADFVAKRLAPAHLPNDGKQTPLKGHPVFIAQHATACCCRKCIRKWHHIDENHDLTKKEQEFIVELIMTWIQLEVDLEHD